MAATVPSSALPPGQSALVNEAIASCIREDRGCDGRNGGRPLREVREYVEARVGFAVGLSAGAFSARVTRARKSYHRESSKEELRDGAKLVFARGVAVLETTPIDSAARAADVMLRAARFLAELDGHFAPTKSEVVTEVKGPVHFGAQPAGPYEPLLPDDDDEQG